MILDVELDVVRPEVGGRRTPFFDGYRPDAWFGALRDGQPLLHGVAFELPPESGVEPGETARVRMRVRHPETLAEVGVSVESGTTFDVREGARVVAHGRVLARADGGEAE